MPAKTSTSMALMWHAMAEVDRLLGSTDPAVDGRRIEPTRFRCSASDNSDGQ